MGFATLTIDINAKFAELSKGFKQVEKEFKNLERVTKTSANSTTSALKSITKEFQNFKGVLSNVQTVFSVLTVGAGIGGIVQIGKAALDSAAALDDMAESTGASVESLSKLTDIAKIGGKDIAVVETTLIAMQRALSGTDEESDKAAQALAAIGIQFKDIKSLAPERQFDLIARALSEYADGQGKTAAGLAIFNRSWKDASSIIKDYNDNLGRSASLTTEQAAQAEQLQKDFNALTLSITNAGRALILDFAEGVKSAISWMRGLAAESGTFVEINRTIAALGSNLPGKVGEFFARQRDQLRQTGATGSWQPGATGSWGEPIKPQVAFTGAAKKATGGRASGGGGARGKSDAERELERARDDLTQLDRELSRLTAKTEDQFTKVEEVRFEITKGKWKDRAEPWKKEALGIAETIDATNEFIKAQKALAKAAEDGEKAFADLQKTRAEDAQTIAEYIEPMEVLRKKMEAAADLVERGFLKPEQFSQFAVKTFDDANKAADKTKSIAEELGMTFSSAFEDAIVGGKKFSEILKGLEQDIVRIVTRQLVTEPFSKGIADVAKGLFSGGGGGGDLFGNLVVSLFGARQGAAFAGGNVMPFARGGVVGGPTLFPLASGAGLMGESGPEAVLPLKRHRSGSLGVSGGVNVQMTVYAQDASSFTASKSQILGDLNRAVARGVRGV